MLYERHQVEPLVKFMMRHTRDRAEILIADPGRGNGNAFIAALTRQGFGAGERRGLFDMEGAPSFKGRLITLQR